MNNAEDTGHTLCPCGQALPHHLAEFDLYFANDDVAFTHTCLCERYYEVRNKKFYLVGTKPNPFKLELN